MTLTGALVLFALYWFLGLFWMLPLRIRTQSESGEVIPGTPASAPMRTGLRWKAWAATGIAAALLALTTGIIEFGIVTTEDIDRLLERSAISTRPAG